MIIFFPVILKQLFHLGRFYSWPKPERCPRCGGHRLWGHGHCQCGSDQCGSDPRPMRVGPSYPTEYI